MAFILRWFRRLTGIGGEVSALDMPDVELFALLTGWHTGNDRRKISRVDFRQSATSRADSAYRVEILVAPHFPKDCDVVLCFPQIRVDRHRILRITSWTNVDRLQPEIQRRLQNSSDTGPKLLVYIHRLEMLYVCENCSDNVEIRHASQFGTALGSSQAFTYYDGGCLLMQEFDGQSNTRATFLLQPPGTVVSSDRYMMVRKPTVIRPIGQRHTSQARPARPPERAPQVLSQESAVESLKSMTRGTSDGGVSKVPPGGLIDSSDDDGDEYNAFDTRDHEFAEEGGDSSSGEGEEDSSSGPVGFEQETLMPGSGEIVCHPETGRHLMVPMVQMDNRGHVIAYDTSAQAVMRDQGTPLFAAEMGLRPDDLPDAKDGNSDIFESSSG